MPMRMIGSGPESGSVIVVIGKCSASKTFMSPGEFVATTCISR